MNVDIVRVGGGDVFVTLISAKSKRERDSVPKTFERVLLQQTTTPGSLD